MTSFLLASHPRPVRLAIERHRRGLDANPHEYLEREPALDERVLAAAARYVGGAPGELALTGNTTTGLALVYRGIRVGAGDELLTSTHDFYSTHEALRLRAQTTGASLRKIQLYRDPAKASVDEILSSLAKAIAPATRVVALTWVHSSTGVKLPVTRIAAVVRNANRDRPPDKQALLCIDGVHGFGSEATPAARLGCDFFVTGAHKWLFGPRGTGLVWGRASAWQRVTPLIPSFSREAIGAWMSDRVPSGRPGPLMTPGGYQAFEHRWALAEAFQFRNTIGSARTERRTHELATRLKQGLRGVRGVSLITPLSTELSAGLVCCSVEGVDPYDAVARLDDRRIVASVTPYATPYLRFGPSILNSPADVDRTVAAVQALT
jgi:selenocysteine lyase/cysteine desulfurase